tara:strand:- start:543 stop:1442 length:900 start_codon:yes stop_codon:yes gene_type:complete
MQIWNNCKNIKKGHWLDLETGVEFSSENNWTNSTSKNSFFISDRSNFILGNPRDIKYVLSYYAPFFGRNMICNDEIMCSNNPNIKKFKNSKILVVGGGPTAVEREWDPNDYDFVFSCNHFYLNDKLNNHDVALATFSTETDFSESNTLLHNYLSSNSTIVCFEDRMQDEERKFFHFMSQKYSGRTMWSHTRYRGKIGSTPRLLSLAIFFGAKEIHFVGMDGMSKDTQKGDLHNHAFQKGKKYNQSSLNYDMYRRHYVGFWDYIINDLKMHRVIKFQNLGEGHPKNQTTDISKSVFPLGK